MHTLSTTIFRIDFNFALLVVFLAPLLKERSRFRLHHNADSTVSLQSAFGRFVSLGADGSVSANQQTVDLSSKFSMALHRANLYTQGPTS